VDTATEVAIAGAVLFLFLPAVPARADDCPPGSVRIHVERTEDEERIACKCQPGYVARQRQCVPLLPTLSGSFISPDQIALIQRELNAARSRQERLSREIAKLDRLRQDEDDYLQEIGEIREQLLYDSVSDILSVVSNDELLSHVRLRSVQDAERLAQAAKALKASVDAVAAAQSGEERARRREKAYAAAGGALSVVAALSVPESEREALATAIEVSAEVMKAVDPARHENAARLRDRVARALDDLAGIAGAAYKPLAVGRSAVNLAGSAVVGWQLRTDKDAIVEALVSGQRAKLAADQRLAATESLIAFYETELRRAGK